MSHPPLSRAQQLSERIDVESLAAQALASPEAFRQSLSNTPLLNSESDELYQAACDARDAAQVHEKCLLARSSPLLQNAVSLGIQAPQASLRDYEGQFGNRASRFTSPGSVSSMFSPAAYLTALYRNARDLYPEDSTYHIDVRRPDLKALALSQRNMSQEVSALALSTEVLMTLARDKLDVPDNDGVLKHLSSWRQSGSTPYHHAHARLHQSRLQKDPHYAQLAANPRVAGLFSGGSMAAMAFDISPELHAILTEEITADTADKLVKDNFGDGVELEHMLAPQSLRRFYGLTDEQMQLFSNLSPQDEYVDNVLTTRVGDKIYRLECRPEANPDQLNFARLFPQANGSYRLQVSFAESAEVFSTFRLRLGAKDGGIVLEHLNTPLTAGRVYNFDVRLGELALDRSFVLYLQRVDPKTNTYKNTSVRGTLSVVSTAAPYLLKLNKAIRLWRATGMHPRALLAIVNSVNPDNITEATLALLFHIQRCTQRYAVEPEEALALCGGVLSQAASDGELSPFDRVFNNPPLNGQVFTPSTLKLHLTPANASDHPGEKAVLKRALQVDDAGLYALHKLFDSGSTDGSFELSLQNLSSLYALSRWARLHGLSVTELAQLLPILGCPKLEGQTSQVWIANLQAVDAQVQWLASRQWTVADLLLMTRSEFDSTATNDLGALLAGLKAVVDDNSETTDLAAQISLLAPVLATALGLPTAALAESVLTWANSLAPGGWTVNEFWNGEPASAQAIAFGYGLAQLALIYHATGISAQAFSLFVAQPQRLQGDAATVLPRTLATLQGLCGFAGWLKGLGDTASTALSAFVADSLTPAQLAEAQGMDVSILQQAAEQAAKHNQLAGTVTLGSWSALDSVQQWVAVSTAFGVAPLNISELLSLDYGVKAGSWERWTRIADAFAAGLKPRETAGMEAALAPALSAALCGYLLKEKLAGRLTSDDREGLYQYLLLDNLNGPQVITSRVAEAIVSLQTFVQRTLSAPESAVRKDTLTAPFFADWERYNQRYSTWAGAAKLVYYPENYVDPTVRLGQTAMMDEMLQTLGQAQLNSDTVGDAFHTYLSGFEEVANLRVISAYHDHLSIKEGKTYFVGTNQSEPREFYWRSADEARRGEDGQLAANAWTAWSKVGCAPQPWGDCIRPLMYNSRLYLCWLERQDITPSDAAVEPKTTLADGIKKEFRYVVKLAYLRYDGNWNTPNTFDVSSQVSQLALADDELPGLYSSSYSEKSMLQVLIYKKAVDYATPGKVKAAGIYVYEDMSFDFMTDPVTTVNAVRFELDTDTAATSMVNNAYAMDVAVEQSFTNELRTNKNVLLSAQVINCAIIDEDDAESYSLSLKANVHIELLAVKSAIGITLASVISKIVGDKRFEYYESASNPDDGIVIRFEGKIYTLAKEGDVGNFLLVSSPDANVLGEMEIVPSGVPGYSLITLPDKNINLPGERLDFSIINLRDSRTVKCKYVGESVVPGRVLKLSDLNIDVHIGQQGYPLVSHIDKPDSQIVAGTPLSVIFDVPRAAIPRDWGARSEFTLMVVFTDLLGNVARYQLRLYRSVASENNVIYLRSTPEKAQYMQVGLYRTRLNTLFARKLVERAATGIDTILSYETQNIQEPALGKGFFTTLTLPKYQPAVHGDEPWVKIYYSYVVEDKDTYLAWSGTLSPDTSTQVTLFVPYPDIGWAQKNGHLQVSYKKAINAAHENKSVMFTYEAETNKVTLTRPGSGGPLSPEIVENVTAGNQQTVPMDFAGANALYFWELFYYTPMMAAQRLAQEQQFGLADQWLRYVWSPSGYVVRGNHEPRNWNVRPLLEDTSWNDTPLKATDPDAVAQNDPMHYKVATFMRALDLLIARGDAAYRKLERDTLAEAKVWYSQALNLLGEQPYIRDNAQWLEPSLGDAASPVIAARHMTVLSQLCQGKTCEPKAVSAPDVVVDTQFLPETNEVMQGYWLTLRQRMYNLRHNLTLDGQPLLLPLFAKPADPKALLNAAVAAENGGAAGLPTVDLPLWRFEPMLDSARGLVSQLMQFGNAVQNVLERKDAEALSALLQNQGTELMASSIALQDSVLQELTAEQAVLSKAKSSAQKRFDAFSRLYDENINARERSAMDALTASQAIAAGAKVAHMTAAAADMAPNIFGLANGGMKYGAIGNAVGICINMAADVLSMTGSRITQEEMYRRRRQDWEIQRDNAQGEVEQVEAQLAALEVRRESALLQQTYLQTQQAQAQAQLDFLQTKFSNVALYSWLRGRLSSIYFQFYDLAVSRCLMAERAWHWESGDSSRTFIRGGGWQGTWAGLTCGEGLMLNLAQLEAARMKWSRRTLEVSRTVSLADFYRSEKLADERFELAAAVSAVVSGDKTDAGSLANGIRLEDGQLFVTVTLPDLGIAGDYPDTQLGEQRRIKQLSVSLPALMGPYQDVQAVLSYSGGQQLPPGCNQLAISRGMNDSGMFQPDLNDARWLPFEGVDVNNGSLTLRFPQARGKQQTLLQSLSDIILHINYTIRP